MAKSKRPDHFVVDGSNIATEGRSSPSLEQLNEAVLAFMEEHPGAIVTVVVDATFGHRIDPKEVKGFDEAVANNELVTPPAGAVGRGDAFVLTIADKARAGVLSNDSFQEFHGEYDWLFDDGRLIGGKPVPHVGWVFVERTPVRGPKSRRSVREAKDEARADAKDAKERANRRVRAKTAAVAAEPEPAAAEPAAEATGSRSRRGRGRKKSAAVDVQDEQQQQVIAAAKAASPPRGQVNELMPFLEFVQHHPVGTSCTAVVESYASHGAYARVDDVLLYIPLRLMDDPLPRSARSVLSIGEALTLVIVGYVPDRRSIDAALPHMAGAEAPRAADEPSPGEGPTREVAAAAPTPTAETAPAEPPAATKTPAKKAAKTAARKAPAKKAAAKKTAAKKAATAPAKKAAATKAAATKAAATAPAKKAAAKKTAAKQTPAKKSPAKKASAKRAADGSADLEAPAESRTERTPAKQAPARKAPARKTPAKAPARKTPAKQTAAGKAAAKQTAAGKAAAKQRPARRRAKSTAAPAPEPAAPPGSGGS